MRFAQRFLGGALAAVVIAGAMTAADGAEVARRRVVYSKKTFPEIVAATVGHLLEQAGGQGEPARPTLVDAAALLERIEQVDRIDFAKVLEERRVTAGGVTIELQEVELRLDDRPLPPGRESAKLVLARLMKYVRSTSGDEPGSVELRFVYQVNGVRVRRSDWIADNRFRAVADLTGELDRADRMRLELEVEAPDEGGTRFTTTAYVHAPIGRCPGGPVTRYAERVMADLVDQKLAEVEAEARSIVDSGTGTLPAIVTMFVQEFRRGLRT